MGAGRPPASPADPPARTRASARCPAPQLDAVPGEGATGNGGLQAQVARPAVGFQFPIDLVTALGCVRKAGEAEQALARTEGQRRWVPQPMSSLWVTPVCCGECLWCLVLQSLFEILLACKNTGCRKTLVFLFHSSLRISPCSKLGSRTQPVSAHHLAAKGASPEVLLMSCLTDAAIRIFIFRYLCKEHSSNFCSTLLLKVVLDQPIPSVYPYSAHRYLSHDTSLSRNM